jgi:hypothetical protein
MANGNERALHHAMNAALLQASGRGTRQAGLLDRVRGTTPLGERQGRLNEALVAYETASRRGDETAKQLADETIEQVLAEARIEKQTADRSEIVRQAANEPPVRSTTTGQFLARQQAESRTRPTPGTQIESAGALLARAMSQSRVERATRANT